MGKVTEHLVELIRKQIEKKGIVVWYDPEKSYTGLIQNLAFPETTVLQYTDSFFRLRYELEPHLEFVTAEGKPKEGCGVAPNVVVYVPMERGKTSFALIEAETAGVVVEPGAESPERNSRLRVLTESFFLDVAPEKAAHLARQVEEGLLTLEDLDRISEEVGTITSGALKLIFGAASPIESIIEFASGSAKDSKISEKKALGELQSMVKSELGLDFGDTSSPEEAREALRRIILLAEFKAAIPEAGRPSPLSTVHLPEKPMQLDALKHLCETWRHRVDFRGGYVEAARDLEKAARIGQMKLNPKDIEAVETFPCIESLLVRSAQTSLLEGRMQEAVSLAELRKKSFWSREQPEFLLGWSCLELAGRFLKEAARVRGQIKTLNFSAVEMVRGYALFSEPWMTADRLHRHWESRLLNLDLDETDEDDFEKLMAKVRKEYADLADEMSRAFVGRLHEADFEIKGILPQALVKEKGRHTFIDKVKVRYLAQDDKYWAELVNFGNKYLHVPDYFVRNFDRLLMGGVWAQVEIRHEYDEEARGRRSPFWIEHLTPIQLASFNHDEYRETRSRFTSEEWVDLLIRSIGLEPSQFNRRLKLLFLLRLVPLCEANYNLVELGPRGTGKSFAYQELSPYVILLTGPTTLANLFYNIASGKIGLVGLWDAVGFDEVADLQKMPKEVVTTLKTFCESGSFARGKESLTGQASIAMFGNTNQPVEVMVRSSHLFMPMPEVIRDDLSFLDRIHCYLPGWEVPKMRMEFFTAHYGFVVDYLAEAMRELRRHNYTELVDRYFSLGDHLNARDVKAVRKTVSGLLKLIYPEGDATKDEMAELLSLASESRRRVKEQLKKIGAFEYHQTSFSYRDKETTEETYVGVPEEGGRNVISTDPLAPGCVYAASVNPEGKVGLYRIEVGVSSGTGKLKLAGGLQSQMKESAQRAFAFLQGHRVPMGITGVFDTTDFHVESIDLLGNKIICEAGVAFIVAICSAIKKVQAMPGLIVLGDLSIQGNIKAVQSLVEPLQMAMENGARRALIPLENKRNFLEVSGEIMEKVDPIFYSDPQTAAMKALALK